MVIGKDEMSRYGNEKVTKIILRALRVLESASADELYISANPASRKAINKLSERTDSPVQLYADLVSEDEKPAADLELPVNLYNEIQESVHDNFKIFSKNITMNEEDLKNIPLEKETGHVLTSTEFSKHIRFLNDSKYCTRHGGYKRFNITEEAKEDFEFL